MRCRRHHVGLGVWAAALVASAALTLSAQSAQTVEALSAKVWIGHHAEYEEYLRTANVDKTEELSLGVTRPRRVFFPPGGLAESAAWKAIRPGHYKGYWESYQSEVAAYELDKLLDLQMVPPVVERRVGGATGAAVLWVKPVKMYKEVKPADIRDPGRWAVQLDKMRLFDQLIGNSDRNAGNFLLDPEGNLILIDHSRAFPTNERMTMDKVPRIDTALWARIETFSDEALTKPLDSWLMGGQVKSLLKRRELLRKEIEKRKAAYGKAKVSQPVGEP